MDKYILELVNSNERVILPDLGAFLNRKSKTRHISFNEFLKFNDGLVVKYIAEKENLNNRDATKKVDDYIKRIRETLESGKSYEIKGLGELKKNDRGRIDFYMEDKGKHPVQPMEKEDIPGKKIDIPGKKQEPKPPVETKETKEKSWEKDDKIISPANEPAKKSSISSTSTDQYNTTSTTKSYTETDEEEFSRKKRKRTLWITLLIVILGLLIACGIYFRKEVSNTYKNIIDSFVSKDRPSRRDLLETLPPEPEITRPVDTLRELESAVPEEATRETTSSVSDETGKYHIITGSFMNGNFATKYLAKMEAKGYEARIIRHRQNFYSVSVESFSNKQEALRALELVRQDVSSAWLLYH
ncbi:MAG: SPOR domain-containing protein [Bacteroidales bacterium]